MGKLEDLKKQLLEKSKGNIMTTLGEDEDKEWLTSPALDLNRILSGSLNYSVQVGNHTALVGPEACLDEDTFIPYETWSTDGSIRRNHKGGTIKNLYKRFHKIKEGNVSSDYFWQKINDSVFYVKSINENNAILKNYIVDVVKTGKKECFKLTTKRGYNIITTKDHKFYIGYGIYTPLEKLNIGDKVYVHNSTRHKNTGNYKCNHKEVMVKYHPKSSTKDINGYIYYRVRRSHMVVEAQLNNMGFEEYRNYLNTAPAECINNLMFIPDDCHVHHKNKVTDDDRYENLEIVRNSDHLRKHATENHNNLRFIVVEDEVVNIEPVGKKETYDIKCLSPYNNYIANNIVTHNSGKSSFMALILADAQKKGYLPVIIDAEGAWDKSFAIRWGIDPDNVLRIKSLWVEDILVKLTQLIDDGFTDLAIALDSVGALETRKMIDDGKKNDVKADQGRVQKEIKRLLKMIVSLTKFNNCVSFSAGHYYGDPTGYGEPEKVGGGKYYRLSADTIITLKKYPIYEFPNEKKDKRGKVIGTTIKAATLKNRKYPPFQEATVEIDYQNGVNSMAGLIDVGLDIGIIQKNGAWYSMDTGERLGQGEANVLKNLNSGDLADTIKQRIEEYLKTTGYSSINRNLELSEKEKEEEVSNENDDIEDINTEEESSQKKKKPGRPPKSK
ncbi:MAG: hypothetical protein ACOCP4_00900 [Candidatus Woesearchaeota archaeon]